MFRPFLHHTLLAAGILLGSHAAFAENRVALVIGQSNYRAVVPLPNPANDARAMSLVQAIVCECVPRRIIGHHFGSLT